MAPLKVLGICGSLRKASANGGMMRAAAKQLPAGTDYTLADISELPFFNSDIMGPAGMPASVQALRKLVHEADAFVFGCPEYNWGYTAALKNAVDWASIGANETYSGFKNKPALILSTGGVMGGNRAAMQFRQVCAECKLLVSNDYLSIPRFVQPAPFDDATGDLTDEALIKRLEPIMANFATWAAKVKSIA